MQTTFDNGIITVNEVTVVFLNWTKVANVLEGYEFIPLPELKTGGKAFYITDFFEIAYNYITKFLIFDFLATVPILTAKFYYYS
jgi:hypothetical protein